MEYKVYWTRWLLLLIESATSFTRMYISEAFAILNEEIAHFFNVDPYEIDVLAIVDTLVAVPLCLLIALIGSRFGIRFQMIAKASCMLVGTALCTISFLSKDLYWLVLISRVLMGLPQAIMYVLPIILAAHWFPQTETATAFGIPLLSMNLGGGIAGIMLPFLLQKDIAQLSASSYNDTIFNKSIVMNITDICVKKEIMETFGIASVAMLIAFIMTIIFAKDHPPTPPSAAQLRILNLTGHSNDDCCPPRYISRNLKQVKKLFVNREFLLLNTAIFFKASNFFIEILSASFILHTFPYLDERTPGVILVLAMFAGAIGAVVGGRLLDKLKSFKLLLVISQSLLILCIVGVFLSHFYHNLPSMYILYPLALAMDYVSFTATVEFLTEATYPADKVILTSLFNAFYSVGIFLFISIERLVMENTSENESVLLVTVLLCISLFFILFARPEYKRNEVEVAERREGHEEISANERARLIGK